MIVCQSLFGLYSSSIQIPLSLLPHDLLHRVGVKLVQVVGNAPTRIVRLRAGGPFFDSFTCIKNCICCCQRTINILPHIRHRSTTFFRTACITCLLLFDGDGYMNGLDLPLLYGGVLPTLVYCDAVMSIITPS